MRIRRPTATSDEFAAFAEAVRAAVPETPGPGLEAAIISRLAQEASAASTGYGNQPTEQLPGVSLGALGGWRPRLALAGQVAAAIALVPLVAAALAVAGVTLPEPARDAFERVGIELPNQPSASGSNGSDAARKHGADGSGHGSKSADQSTNGAGGATGAGKHGDRGRHGHGGKKGPKESRGQGEPQHGAPAPIVPPGQGGTPPGQGGSSPSSSGSAPGQTETAPGQAKQLSTTTGGGTTEGVPPGEAKK